MIVCDSNLVLYRKLTIVGANGSSPAQQGSPRADCIRCGACRDLITHTLPLDDVLDAFQIVSERSAIKVTIEP